LESPHSDEREVVIGPSLFIADLFPTADFAMVHWLWVILGGE
jgi:hypothetical protein